MNTLVRILFSVASAMWSTYAVMTIWNWFIAPTTFHMSYRFALGIGLAMGIFQDSTHAYRANHEPAPSRTLRERGWTMRDEAMVNRPLGVALVLGIAYLLHMVIR